MKNASWLPVFFALCVPFIGCDKGGKDCDKSINAVQPNTNPAGYEVLIKTNGFSPAAKVVFGTVEATSRAGGESDDIIAKVPAGLSGNVEISVEEGDCIARSGGFLVSGSLPTGVQPSLPQIIVPSPLTNVSSDIANVWTNAASTFDAGNNAEHTILIGVGTTVGNIINFEEPFSKETIKLVVSLVSGFANISTGEVQLTVDRTTHGGIVEHFDGHFVAKPNSVTVSGTSFILLVSRETGRQLLIYK
ncbi:MAG: IPT/TIG domain-containing protein [Saprospiraceae bacterium]